MARMKKTTTSTTTSTTSTVLALLLATVALLAPPVESDRPKVGVLVVGLSGNNGATLAATLEAAKQRRTLEWEGPQGPVRADDVVELGCVSQLADGPCGEWLGPCRVGRMEDMVLGGWEVRRAHVGDALHDSRVLPHDLVRRIRPRLNKLKVWPGVYEPSFVGPNQRAAARHVIDGGGRRGGAGGRRRRLLERVRRDIRGFQQSHRMQPERGDHTTVIWSATVERPSNFSPETAEALMKAFEDDDENDGSDAGNGSNDDEYDVSPSLIYATAAALEGCSFVNGGSQNTLCRGLLELAERGREGLGPPNERTKTKGGGCYVLGTDFKAGQTKFKTAALEYALAVGMRPKVLASSNHLGNNDMRSLLFPATVKAKLRVKEDIFGPWNLTSAAAAAGAEEGSAEAMADPHRHSRVGLEHKVKVSFTDFIGDEKRDIAEYTALGLLGSPWTMLTYTRAMDSVLCVPLMLDAAAWCGAFSAAGLSLSAASRATAYLFKVPEGGALGQDPGFFKQMADLKATLQSISEDDPETAAPPTATTTATTATTITTRSDAEGLEWAREEELPGAIACAGLACLDMQLLGVEGGAGGEGGEKKGAAENQDQSIRPFGSVVTCAGGSAPQAAAALARLRVRGCCIARVGDDANGGELRRLLRESGAAASSECFIEEGSATSVAVLPIFKDGSRGCFVELGANDRLSPSDVLSALDAAATAAAAGSLPAPHGRIAALHFGYPHLLPACSGKHLVKLLRGAAAKAASDDRLVVSLDLNGVTAASNPNSAIPPQALKLVDVLHMNEEEAALLMGKEGVGSVGSEADDDEAEAFCRSVAEWAHSRGVSVLLLTLGPRGCFVSTTPHEGRLAASLAAADLPPSQSLSSQQQSPQPRWPPGESVRLPAFALAEGSKANANGAGDTFCAAFLAAMLWRRPALSLRGAATVAALAALHHVDSSLRDRQPQASLRDLVATVVASSSAALEEI